MARNRQPLTSGAEALGDACTSVVVADSDDNAIVRDLPHRAHRAEHRSIRGLHHTVVQVSGEFDRLAGASRRAKHVRHDLTVPSCADNQHPYRHADPVNSSIVMCPG